MKEKQCQEITEKNVPELKKCQVFVECKYTWNYDQDELKTEICWHETDDCHAKGISK